MKIGRWLRRAEKRYAETGAAMGQIATEPRDEALYLILRTLGLPLESGPEVLAREVSAADDARLAEVFRRRLDEHVPAAYLTGEAWLGGLRFHVDPRVLIPGPVARVADLCTGSGCLAILLAKHFPKAKVDAIDLSPGALAVAARNVRAHRLQQRVRLVQSNLLRSVPAGRYDIILTNPPYEPTAHVDQLPAEFRQEPRLALDGGADGLDLIRTLVRQAATRLRPHGILMIEVGGGREPFQREFGHLAPHWFHTADGSDCVCLLQAARLRRPQPRARS